MKDTKIVFALVGMVEALRMDHTRRRAVAGQVTAELLCMPEERISDIPEKAAYQAQEWVKYSYDLGELPEWYTGSHMSREW